jgi:hypothetical protein
VSAGGFVESSHVEGFATIEGTTVAAVGGATVRCLISLTLQPSLFG